MATTTDTATTGELRRQLDDLAKACRILELFGHGDRIYGHVAMRDPDGRGFWLKRHQISFGEVTGPGDFLLVDFAGHVLAGEGRRASEWPIHAEILQTRPDVRYTGHTHPFHCIVYSALSTPFRPIKDRSFGVPRRYPGSSDLITTPERGRDVAHALGDGWVVLMRNHGVAFCGRRLIDLLMNGIGIEESCREMLLAASLGVPAHSPDPSERAPRTSSSSDGGRAVWDYYCRALARAEAAGDFRLAAKI